MASPSKQKICRPGRGASASGMELLAPAGSFPAFEAALEQGADAIYVGAPGFNARALSRDFTFAEIDSMVRQAHGQGVKLYIAMNSLVKEDELPTAIEALSCFRQLAVDALIIQDIGLLYLARTWFPEIVLHASTLMSVHNSLTAKELIRLGCKRVVLARELTIEEMGAIYRKTGAEIEVFVHGAMCFSYSGLCMFSSLHGGKSSLRGQCVQPCRRHYSWGQPGRQARSGRKEGKSQYLFSMNDLCGVDVLPELQQAGVRCLKIEGRMKSACYVANTVAAYRMALDSLDKSDEEQECILREAHRLLDGAMARKRSTGFMLTQQPGGAISPQHSGNSGLFLGRVHSLSSRTGRQGKQENILDITLAAPVAEGDRLRLHQEKSGERTSFTLRVLTIAGRRQKSAGAGERVKIVQRGTVKNPGRHFNGSLFKVDVGTRIVAERTGQRRQRKLSSRKIFPDRQLVQQILEQLCCNQNRPRQQQTGKRRGEKRRGEGNRRMWQRDAEWWIALRAISDLRQRLPVRPARIVLPLSRDNMDNLEQRGGSTIKKYRAKIVWRLPQIMPESELAWFEKQIKTLVAQRYFRYELGHLCQYALFAFVEKQNQSRLELSGHYSLNLLNSAGLRAVQSLGLRRVLFSLETDSDNLAAALFHWRNFCGRTGKKRRQHREKMSIGLYVYGRPPLFTARLDSDHFQYKKIFVSPKEERFTLEHHQGLTMARSVHPFSLLQWRREIAAMGMDYLFMDLTGGAIKKEGAMANSLVNGGGKRVPILSGNFHSTLV